MLNGRRCDLNSTCLQAAITDGTCVFREAQPASHCYSLIIQETENED
jgi:hypothetical protein